MVGAGVLMLALVLAGNVMRRRGAFVRSAAFLRLCEWSAPLGFVAVLAGWTVTEVGRQPWTVFGLLRTADSVSPSLTGNDVLLSLIGYIVVYALIFPSGFLVMRRIVRNGPRGEAAGAAVQSGRPALPIDAIQAPIALEAAR
jgi:cytochrome d ubiquinol oxidase subunit I